MINFEWCRKGKYEVQIELACYKIDEQHPLLDGFSEKLFNVDGQNVKYAIKTGVNKLEKNRWETTPDRPFVITGTVGERWPVKLKDLTSYDVNIENIEIRPIKVSTLDPSNQEFLVASHIPLGKKFKVIPKWAFQKDGTIDESQVLIANLETSKISHMDGDYIVAKHIDGYPEYMEIPEDIRNTKEIATLYSPRIINGSVMQNTYDHALTKEEILAKYNDESKIIVLSENSIEGNEIYIYDENSKKNDYIDKKAIKISSNITSIDGAFADCHLLVKIYLSKKKKKIGDGTFKNCENLREINLQNIKKIGKFAFLNCQNLEDIELANVEEIDDQAFNNCQKLKKVVADKVKHIGEYAFCNCHSLKIASFNIVETIQTATFFNCNNLENINIRNVKDIGNIAFYGCKKLQRILLDNVQIIRESAFMQCNSLSKVVLSDNKIIICSGVFNECENLKKINLETVAKIESGAFINCHKLETANLENAKEIDFGAFNSCNSLVEVKLPYYSEEIHEYAFYNCPNLKDIKHILYIPNNLEPWRDIFEANLKICNNIIFSNESITSPFVSKFGGCPYMLKEDKWPLDYKGDPLLFYCQINFAEMPELDDFPKSGILQIFYTSIEDGMEDIMSAKCKYIQDNEIIYEEELLIDKLPYENIDGYHSLIRCPKRILFNKSFDTINGNCREHDRIIELIEEESNNTVSFHEVINYTNQFCFSKVGGNPSYTQYVGSDYEDYILLFQICDSYDNPIGDGGSVQFMIKKEDLLKCDFSHVVVYCSGC